MRNIISLLLLSTILCACSSKDLPVISSDIDTENSAGEESLIDQNMYSETNADGIRLELIEVSGSDPLYTLSFKKKDMGSGKYLNFMNSSSKRGTGMPNIDVKVEPSGGYGYWAGPKDECHVNVYNIDRNDSVKIIISGMEYTFTPHKEKTEEKVIDKSVQVQDGTVTIKKAVSYPDYLALYIDADIGRAYYHILWALDARGDRETPIVYKQKDGIVLIFNKEDVFYDNVLHLQVAQSEGYENMDIGWD